LYIGGTPENKHPKKHPWEQHPTKSTSPPKIDSFTKTTTVKTISNTVHRHYSPSKKNPLKTKLPILNTKAKPPLKNSYPKDHSVSTMCRSPIHQRLNSQSWTPKLSHLWKTPIRKIIQFPPCVDLRSTKRNHKKPKTKHEPKNWLPISNQKWSAHQTLGPNQKGTPNPGTPEKHQITPNKIAARHRNTTTTTHRHHHHNTSRIHHQNGKNNEHIVTRGVCHQNKQNLKHNSHLRKQPQPPRSLRRQTIREFVEGGLIVNEWGVTTPATAENRSNISVPHITPTTPHVRHHHRLPLHIAIATHHHHHITTPTAHHHHATALRTPPNSLGTTNTRLASAGQLYTRQAHDI